MDEFKEEFIAIGVPKYVVLRAYKFARAVVGENMEGLDGIEREIWKQFFKLAMIAYCVGLSHGFKIATQPE